MNISLKEIHEKLAVGGSKHIVHDAKLEIESKKKHKTKGNKQI